MYNSRLAGERRCELEEKYLLEAILNMQEMYILIFSVLYFFFPSLEKYELEISIYIVHGP